MPLERPQIDKPEGDIPFDLGIDDLIVGDGAEATKGSKVSVHYAGVAFSTGEEFDASWNRGQPFTFKLGKGQVIPGWDAGVVHRDLVAAPRLVAVTDDEVLGAELERDVAFRLVDLWAFP